MKYTLQENGARTGYSVYSIDDLYTLAADCFGDETAEKVYSFFEGVKKKAVFHLPGATVTSQRGY